MSRFTETAVTSVGSHSLMTNFEARPGRPPTLHISGSSFNAVVRATNFYNTRTGVSCYWTDISSPLTTAGMYNLPDFSYKAVVVQVNSVAGSIALSVG
jgi:hypothetical protein